MNEKLPTSCHLLILLEMDRDLTKIVWSCSLLMAKDLPNPGNEVEKLQYCNSLIMWFHIKGSNMINLPKTLKIKKPFWENSLCINQSAMTSSTPDKLNRDFLKLVS